MTMGYLNGNFAPLSELQISPMDRGFLFGDGVYEVIPCYDGEMVAMSYHIERLHQSMDGIALSSPHSDAELISLLEDVVARNGGGDLGIYLQLTREWWKSVSMLFLNRASPLSLPTHSKSARPQMAPRKPPPASRR